MDTGFEEFWIGYPRKTAKKHALKMWNKLTDEQRQKALKVLPLHCEYWIAVGRDEEGIPHAGTWLNGERFEDVVKLPKTNGKRRIESLNAEIARNFNDGNDSVH